MLSRVLSRIAVALKREKGPIVAAFVLVAAIVVMAFRFNVGVNTFAQTTDCADKVVAVRMDNSEPTLRGAYRCLTPAMTFGNTEDQFVNLMSTVPLGKGIIREFTYTASNGTKVVDFIVIQEDGVSPANWSVYLNADGKVFNIE